MSVETFIGYLLMNLTNYPLKQTNWMENSTKQFLAASSSAALVSNNPQSWQNIHFDFPVQIRDINTNSRLQEQDYIVDVRNYNWNSGTFQSFTRKTSTKFVVITQQKDFETLKETLTKVGLCHCLILTDSDTHYLEDNCKGIGKGLKPISCRANVSFMHLVPSVLPKRNKLTGIEGEMMQAAADNLNFNLSFINRHEIEWGSFSPPSGLLGDIQTGTSVIGLGSLFPFAYRFTYGEAIVICRVVSISAAVPIGTGPSQPTWYIILVSEMSKEVWGCVFLTYITLIPISMLFDKGKDKQWWPFYILGVILGIPMKITQQKSLTLSVMIFGFLLTLYYQAMMSSKLTIDRKQAEIKSLEELTESGLKIHGPDNVGPILKSGAAQDPIVRKLSQKFEGLTEDFVDLLPKMVEKRDISYIRHSENLYYLAQQNPKSAGRVHIVDQPLTTYQPIAILKKHSCLAPRFKRKFDQLCESGLVQKWFNEFAGKKRNKEHHGFRKLTLEHIKGFLYLLSFGWFLALVAFLSEIFYFYLYARRKNNVKK